MTTRPPDPPADDAFEPDGPADPGALPPALAAELASISDEADRAVSGDKTTGADDPELASLLESYGQRLESELRPGRGDLFLRIDEALRSEELVTPRRLSRLNSRFILYATQLAASVMILLTYAGAMASLVTLKKRQRKLFTENEIRALVITTKAWMRRKESAPPAGMAALVEALSAPRDPDSGDDRPFFEFEARRLDGKVFRDPWKRPYVYRVDQGRIMIYSMGPNGADENGSGDDITLSLDLD